MKILNKLILNYITKSKYDNEPMVIFNDWIGKNVLIYGFYEKKIVQTIISSFDFDTSKHICIDVGANIGNHAIQFSKKFKQVICFEPQIKTFKVLELNTHNIKNISIYNYGLSCENKVVSFKIPFNNIGMASQNYDGKNFFIEKVNLKNYDEFFNTEISFIKIDVEGNEIDVINSMKKTILKHKPVISFELNSDFEKRKEILEIFKEMNYNIFLIEKEYKIEKIIKSNNFFFTALKNIIKLISPRPKEELTRISKLEIVNSKKNYNLVTTFNKKSNFKIKYK